MASEKQLDHRRRVLRARGVPERFVDKLATRGDGVVGELMVAVAGFAVLMVIAVTGVFWMRPALGMVGGLLYGHARPALLIGSESLSFTAVFGMLALLLVSLLMAGAGILFRRPAKSWPAYNGIASGLRQPGRGETLASVRPNKAYAALAGLADDTAFLDALARRSFRAAWRAPAIFAVALVVACVVASQCYWRLTTAAYEVHRPWGSHVYPLSTVESAEISCGPQGRAMDVFRYWLVFPEGRYDIAEMQIFTQPELNWQGMADRVAIVNRGLLARKVPVNAIGGRGDTRQRFNACLARWRSHTHVSSAFPESLPEN